MAGVGGWIVRPGKIVRTTNQLMEPPKDSQVHDGHSLDSVVMKLPPLTIFDEYRKKKPLEDRLQKKKKLMFLTTKSTKN